MPAYGRRPSPHDERDFCLAAYLPRAVPASTKWALGPVLDQGQTPTCVGHGGADWGNCLPVCDNFSEADALKLYAECKAIDNDGQDGSYVRTLAKVLKARGRLSAYAFGNLANAKQFILGSGPVVLGITWTYGMEEPDAAGTIKPTGGVAGGHCVLAYGADSDYCYIQNSWGAGWGVNGCCRISWADLQAVFDSDGEAMAAVELPLAPPVPNPDAKGCLTSALGLLTSVRLRSKKLWAAIDILHEMEAML